MTIQAWLIIVVISALFVWKGILSMKHGGS